MKLAIGIVLYLSVHTYIARLLYEPFCNIAKNKLGMSYSYDGWGGIAAVLWPATFVVAVLVIPIVLPLKAADRTKTRAVARKKQRVEEAEKKAKEPSGLEQEVLAALGLDELPKKAVPDTSELLTQLYHEGLIGAEEFKDRYLRLK